MRLHVCFIHQPLWQRAVRTCPLCPACPCKGPAWGPGLPPAVLEETLTLLLSSLPWYTPCPTEGTVRRKQKASRRRCLGPPLPVCDRVCTTRHPAGLARVRPSAWPGHPLPAYSRLFSRCPFSQTRPHFPRLPSLCHMPLTLQSASEAQVPFLTIRVTAQ